MFEYRCKLEDMESLIEKFFRSAIYIRLQLTEAVRKRDHNAIIAYFQFLCDIEDFTDIVQKNYGDKIHGIHLSRLHSLLETIKSGKKHGYLYLCVTNSGDDFYATRIDDNGVHEYKPSTIEELQGAFGNVAN
ncbi:MAG: hypothetical protein RR420_00850 [Anaerovoracaceae bacterium]